MSDINTLILSGNVGGDPEVKYLASGTAIANFSLAVNRNFQSNGEWKKETDWFRVNIFGKSAESLAQRVSKGDKVLVEGRMQSRSYEDKQGVKRIVWEVQAFRVTPVNGNAKNGNTAYSSAQGELVLTDPDDLPFE